jgi:hypothetical protein
MKGIRKAGEESPKVGAKPVKKKAQRTLNIKELLLSGPRFDLELPKRKSWRRRPLVIFD